GRTATPFQYFMIVLMLVGLASWRSQAQDAHTHAASQEAGSGRSSQAGALLQAVREATEGFKDVKAAETAGYILTFGCVTGPDQGAMGLHFVNFSVLKDVNVTGIFDASRPQIIIYEPTADGSLRITGADFLVFADAWKTTHPDGQPPQLMGQLFHLFDTPNRFGLPAFYTLHVWAWKENPNGAFVNWHPNVSCQNFSGKTP
ncbi:MAG TPA: hypothetical protein VFT65_07240, partial [Candidatus Angelobacter sp.]|nr:hypothetical protein [Candidatus Angelobacter sp.]